MAEHENRITGPIDIAVKRLAEQSDRLMETLVGPQPRQQRQPSEPPTFSLEPFLRENELETLDNPIAPNLSFGDEQPLSAQAQPASAASQGLTTDQGSDPLSELEALVRQISSRQM